MIPPLTDALGRRLSGMAGWGAQRSTSALATFGRGVQLALLALLSLVVDLVRLRHPWRETVSQMWFIITVTAVPAILVAAPFGVIVSVQIGSLTNQVGATSVAGAAGGIGVIQQGAPMVAALLLGGAAASAIASDLGARTIREEIDAMRVMGIDPIRRLVVPRLVAIGIVAPMLCMLVIFMGLLVGYVIAVMFMNVTPGSYTSSFAAFASVADVVVAMIKSIVFALTVGVIACQRGLETRFGPKAVADSVNAAVVLGVMFAFGLNVIITQLVAMFLPPKII